MNYRDWSHLADKVDRIQGLVEAIFAAGIAYLFGQMLAALLAWTHAEAVWLNIFPMMSGFFAYRRRERISLRYWNARSQVD
jgi:hypothetical protein